MRIMLPIIVKCLSLTPCTDTELKNLQFVPSYHPSIISPFNQLEFTLSPLVQNCSVFPKLHEPYEKLKELFHQYVNNTNNNIQWKPVIDWCNEQLQENRLLPNEIKMLLFLTIYYNSVLDKINFDQMIPALNFLPEEIRVFKAVLMPEDFMIGYRESEKNALNNLFQTSNNSDDEIHIRHALFNLMAILILTGNNTFLWTFTFEPQKLHKTYGFGSTANHGIMADGVRLWLYNK
ncbi:unnamed protein product [Didymodactylos carnosus]|uniref:Uncharacterized protein n=1 Tax=Didymodactylos carnosus TaxID=1234261 RepID=A0A814B1F5_9BILA|nr:unnamed protein product [Didymodactylos carnosus]CAF3700005.1 unnamed protein product [Didymodactylos carnosus]